MHILLGWIAKILLHLTIGLIIVCHIVKGLVLRNCILLMDSANVRAPRASKPSTHVLTLPYPGAQW